MSLKPLYNLVPNILTEIKALPTKERPISTKLKNPSKPPFEFGFETLDDPDLELMLQAAKDFCLCAAADPLRPYWLSFLGKTGAGKTHLAKAAFRWLRDNVRAPVAGIDAGSCTVDVKGRPKFPWENLCCAFRYVDWRNLAATLRAGNWHEIDDISDAWLVLLDDIGTEYDPSGMIASALDRIINNRLRMWTLITSNFKLPQIAEKFDVRIASRMKREGSIVIEVDVLDYSLR